MASIVVSIVVAGGVDWNNIPLCEAIWPFRGQLPCDLSFKTGWFRDKGVYYVRHTIIGLDRAWNDLDKQKCVLIMHTF